MLSMSTVPEGFVTVAEMAEILGYGSLDGLKRRIRVLRELGLVQDVGKPPEEYKAPEDEEDDEADTPVVVIHWLHPRYYLIKQEIPREHFHTVGRPWPKAENSEDAELEEDPDEHEAPVP